MYFCLYKFDDNWPCVTDQISCVEIMLICVIIMLCFENGLNDYGVEKLCHMWMTSIIYRSMELKSSSKNHNSLLLITIMRSYLGMRYLISIKSRVSAVFPCRISLIVLIGIPRIDLLFKFLWVFFIGKLKTQYENKALLRSMLLKRQRVSSHTSSPHHHNW